jgi:capsular polysaccharide biosynthesis protein
MTSSDIYRALWRQKYFIVALTALMVVFAYLFASRQPKIYETSTLVRVQQRITDPGQPGLVDSEELARTYASIIGTSALHQKIVGSVDGAPDDVEIEATPVSDLGLMWITTRSSYPRMAAEVANAAPPMLRAFIKSSGNARDEIVTIDRAGVPSSPVSPKVFRNVAIAFLLALMLNGVLAFLIELLSDRLPDADDLERSTGKPILVTVPSLAFTKPPPEKQKAGQAATVELASKRDETSRRVKDREPKQGFTVG